MKHKLSILVCAPLLLCILSSCVPEDITSLLDLLGEQYYADTPPADEDLPASQPDPQTDVEPGPQTEPPDASFDYQGSAGTDDRDTDSTSLDCDPDELAGGEEPAGADEEDGDGVPDYEEASDADCELTWFDRDADAKKNFDPCFTAEGRIGSAAFHRDFTYELDLGRPTGAPSVTGDFDWQSDIDYPFSLVWDGHEAVFEVFDCDAPVNAVQVRCSVNLGRVDVCDLEINGVPIDECVSVQSPHRGRRVNIMQLACGLDDDFVLTGTARFTWHESLQPLNSQLAFQLTAGYVASSQPPIDCNGNGVPDNLDIAAGTSSDCDGNDVPDECQVDSDADGLIDQCDECPDDPLKTEPGACGCGVPDTDSDDDGVPDCDDLCPDTPPGFEVDPFGCPPLWVDAGDDVARDEVGLVLLEAEIEGGLPPYSCAWTAPGWEGSSEPVLTVMPTATTAYTLSVTDSSTPPKLASDSVTVTINTHDDLRYTIVAIECLSGGTAYPYSINEAGVVAGYYDTEFWEEHAFVYEGGVMTDLGTLPGGFQSRAQDINNAGQVVGDALDASGRSRAFLWDSAGGMQDLGTLGGDSSVAYAVNEAGQVAGYSQIGSSYHAFLYADGVMGGLDTLDYVQSGAFDVNDQGQVVGILVDEAGHATAFMYDGGVLTDLGSPLLTDSQAWVVNNHGLVAGCSWEPGVDRSFLLADGHVVDLGARPGLPKTYAAGVNDPGQVVGYATDEAGLVSHAFVYAGGQLRDLNDLLVPGHGWDQLLAAYAVNNSGQIVGYGLFAGEYKGFVLTPVP